MKQHLIVELRATFDELIQIYSSFKEEQINVIPYEGSWTPGQVGEHIQKYLSNSTSFLTENIEPTNRPIDEKVEVLKSIFLDYTHTMKSPDFIVPSSDHHEKKNILLAFAAFKDQLLQVTETLDLSPTCKSFELPGIGFLTRLEWITFFIVHTQRHIHQLKKILRILNTKDDGK